MSDKLLAEWFWTDRWIGSSAFGLPLEARGLYREMLTQAWRRGARLPNDPAQVRRMAGITTGEWRRSWPLVERFWRVDGDGLVNDTQLEIYADASARTQRASARGLSGAQALLKRRLSAAQAQLEHQPPSPSPSLSPSPKEQEQKISSEPSNGSEPPELTFSTVGKPTFWNLSSEQLAEWQGLFPNLDVWAEILKAAAWLPANPAKRKTARGMPRFLVAWLTRAVDNGHAPAGQRSVTRTSSAPEPTFEPWTCPHVEDHTSRWRCEQATALGRPVKVTA